MSPERWKALREVLDVALELPPSARSATVARACGDDETLRQEVEAMLRSYDADEPFLEEPLVRLGKSESREPKETMTKAGPYRLAEPIGEGGMGRVYLAYRDDDTFRKEVAVKVLRPGHEGSELLRRFNTERQILANLEHPYVAKLLDGGTTEDGRPYLVMEHVRGEAIDLFCHRQALTLEGRLRLFLKVCEAIQFAHQNLVVHRDLKPSNILVTPEGDPKLLDFGIAKILRPEAFQQTVLPTRTGVMPMTPEYASPEQVRGETVTTATDVYALGILLYELLTRKRPYTIDASSLASIVDAVCRQQPRKPSTAVLDDPATTDESAALREEPVDEGSARREPVKFTEPRILSRRLSGDLDAIVLRALRKEPGERYASAAQLGEDLERHLKGLPVEARRGTFVYLTSKFVRRNRFAVAATVSAFLLLLGFVVTLLAQQQEILDQRDHVLLERNRAEEVSGWLIELFELPAPSRARGEQVTARELLDKGSRSIAADLVDPELKAELLGTIGHTYSQLGLLQEGVDRLTESIALSRRLGAASEDRLGEQLEQLCEVLTLQGELRRAEVVGRELLARLRHRGERGPDLALAIVRVGHLRALLGDHEMAEGLLSEALSEARLAAEGQVLAKTLEYSADQAFRRGEHADARTQYQEALEILRELHGDLHPDVALIKSSLAQAEKSFDYDAAEALFEEAIVTQQELFDGAHPVLATALNNLGSLHYERLRYGKAKERFEQARMMQSELYGERHPKVATTLSNLANVERKLGHLEAAEELYRRALGIFAERLGEEHPDHALSLANLAELLIDKQELAEAQAMAERAVAVTEATLGSQHPRLAGILNTRGQIELERGDYAAAKATLERAIGIAEGSLGDQHPTLAATQANLSVVLTRLKEFAPAAVAMRRALSLVEGHGDQTRQQLEWVTWLADLELRLNHFEAAEQPARQAFEGWSQRAGETDVWTLSVQSILARSLAGQRRLAEAEPLLQDLITKLESLGSSGERRLQRARQRLQELRYTQ